MWIRQGWASSFLITLASVFMILMLDGCTPSNLSSEPYERSPQTTEQPEEPVSHVMPTGTKIDDLDLSGTPVQEVSARINDWAMDKLEETRVLLYNKTEIPITLSDMGVDLDISKTAEGTLRNPGSALSSALKIDSSKASQVLQKALLKFNQPAKNATYKVEKDKFVIVPAQNGRAVDVDQIIRDLQEVALSEVPEQIDVPVREVPASITTESIQALAFDTVLGEYTTKFSVKEENRSANLAAAAKALDGKVILPGEIFSFNNIVGPREPGTGYKDAYVIINGEYVLGTGGGVCQVSSTLYNAILLGNLGIVERVPHALAVGYVPPGQDATVNYPNLDLKFKNDTTSLLYLRTEVIPGALTIRIWGKKTGNSVKIERQVEKEIDYKTEKRPDSKLPAGRVVQVQKGSKGIIVNTWRVLRDAKGNESKQFLGRDVYGPTNRILSVGCRGIS